MTRAIVGIIALAVLVLGSAAWLLSKDMTSADSCASREPVPVIVAFGDSLVAGYGAGNGEDAFSRLSLALGVPVLNLGVSGDTSARARARIDTVLARSPDIAIIVLGGNDALQRIPVEETERNLSAILRTLTDAGVDPILVGVLGGFPRDPYAPMFERLAEAYGVPLVPNVLAGIIGSDALMSDAIHPNAAGYERIAARMQPYVEAACESS